MRTTHHLAGSALALLIAAGAALTPTTARADRRGDRNAAIALGVTAAVLLATQRNKAPGVLVAAGAAYEYARSTRRSRDCAVYAPVYRERVVVDRRDCYRGDWRSERRARERYDRDRRDRDRWRRDRRDRDDWDRAGWRR